MFTQTIGARSGRCKGTAAIRGLLTDAASDDDLPAIIAKLVEMAETIVV